MVRDSILILSRLEEAKLKVSWRKDFHQEDGKRFFRKVFFSESVLSKHLDLATAPIYF